MNKHYVFSATGKPRAKEPFHFVGSGLPNVYLSSGFKLEKDPKYGDLVSIDRLPELFIAIAFCLAVKQEALTGPEFRFLRKRMELSQPALAAQLRVNEQTVANYEKSRTKTTGGPADTAIRLLFLAHTADDPHLAQELRFRAEDLMKPSRRGRPDSLRVEPWVLKAFE